MKHTMKIAFGAIMAGLSIAFMLSTAVIPFLSYAIPALCGALMVILITECGNKWSLIVYAVVSILSLLIVPDKSAGIAYTAIFGYYPILKSLVDVKLPKWLSWTIKMISTNIVMLVLYYISLFFFGIDTEGIEWVEPYLSKWFIAPIIILITCGFFIMYDIVLTGVKLVYKKKWRKKLLKSFK